MSVRRQVAIVEAVNNDGKASHGLVYRERPSWWPLWWPIKFRPVTRSPGRSHARYTLEEAATAREHALRNGCVRAPWPHHDEWLLSVDLEEA